MGLEGEDRGARGTLGLKEERGTAPRLPAPWGSGGRSGHGADCHGEITSRGWQAPPPARAGARRLPAESHFLRLSLFLLL